MEMTTPYMTGKRMPLKATFVVSILRSPDMTKVIRRPPISPRGGDVYVFVIENNANREAWKNDNIHFHHDGTRGQPKTNPVVRKIFFCAMIGDGRWTRDFMKHVYTLYHNPNNFVVIHYLGDESIARDVPRHRKPRRNTKKHTTCSSTAIQVDTSELSPLSSSSDHQEEDEMVSVDGVHDDDNDDYGVQVELGEPMVEIDTIEDDDSGIGRSDLLITYNYGHNYQSDDSRNGASTSVAIPSTSTPGNPFSGLDHIMPMYNSPGLLSEVNDLSHQSLEYSTPNFNPNEPSTSFAHLDIVRGGGVSATVSIPRESEASSVIPKKRLAMRLEGQDTELSAGELFVSSNPSVLPKKRRLDFGDCSEPTAGPSSAPDNPVEGSGDANNTGQSNRLGFVNRFSDVHQESTFTVSDLTFSRTSTQRLRGSVRDGFQNSISSLVQNVQQLQTMLGNPEMWEQNRETQDAGTEPEDPRSSIESFIHSLVASGQLSQIVSKVMHHASNWKQRPGAFNSKYNACTSLICQIRAAWTNDMERARTRLMEVLGRNSVSECDVKNYYHLVTACVVGAFRMQVSLCMFLPTLSAWPAHLQEFDNRTEVEVEENIQCIVGRTLLTGSKLKTLEKMEQVDPQVIRAYLKLLAGYWTSFLAHHCIILPLGLQQMWERGDYTHGLLAKETLVKYTWILMPYQVSETHWVLLVANAQEATVSVINTNKEEFPDISKEIINHWRKYTKFQSIQTGQNLTHWRTQEIPVFNQTDRTSSGVHVMMAAESILCGSAPVVMRTCHVRRFCQYALGRLLNNANFDFSANQLQELIDTDLDLQTDNDHPAEVDGCPSSLDRRIRTTISSTSAQACAVVPSCSLLEKESPDRHSLVQHRSGRGQRRRSDSTLDVSDQEQAIDFSRSQSTVSCEDGQPWCSEDTQSVSDHSNLGTSHPKEHNYANRQSSTNTANSAASQKGPKIYASGGVVNTVFGNKTTGFLFQPINNVPSHQPPVYPRRVESLYPSPRSYAASTSAVQEKPCDMSMQFQLALDSQPSTSSQFACHQEMEPGVVEDLRVAHVRTLPDPPAYRVSESEGITYTELNNVRPSDLQTSSLISSTLSITSSGKDDARRDQSRRSVQSPSSASNSSETISPHPRAPNMEPVPDLTNPRPSTSAQTSERNRPFPVPSTSSTSWHSVQPQGHQLPGEGEDIAEEDDTQLEDRSNLEMLSTVATTDASMK